MMLWEWSRRNWVAGVGSCSGSQSVSLSSKMWSNRVAGLLIAPRPRELDGLSLTKPTSTIPAQWSNSVSSGAVPLGGGEHLGRVASDGHGARFGDEARHPDLPAAGADAVGDLV